MNSLRTVAVLVLSLAGGYFGFRLTGAWVAIPVGAAVLGFASWKLLVGEFVIGLIVLGAGAFGLFYFMVNGVPEISKVTLPPAGVALTQSSGEAAAKLPASGAAGAEPAAKIDPANKDSQGTAALNPSGQPAMKTGEVFRDCTDCPELVVLPAGKFVMGSAATVQGTQPDAAETPQHGVDVRSFAMGQDAVTKGQFFAFVKATGYQTDAERLGGCFSLVGDAWQFKPQTNWRKTAFAQADSHPAVCVTWNDANAYAQWLATSTLQKYRLPTEAEREYATRAGTLDAYWWGDSITPAQANFHADTPETKGAKATWRKATVATKQFAANPLGLYNLHGNVWEWVQDCQHDSYKGAPADATAWATSCVGTRRGVRGGGWSSPAAGLRSAQRSWFEPDLPSHAGGFRVVRDLP